MARFAPQNLRNCDIGRLVVALKEIVLDYNPSTHLLRRIIRPEEHRTIEAASTGPQMASKVKFSVSCSAPHLLNRGEC